MNKMLGTSLVSVFLAVCVASPSFAAEVIQLGSTRHFVPAIYVFGDSVVDVGNNNFLMPPAPRANSPYGIDFPNTITGRFTNGYNLADIVAQRLGYKMSPPAYLSLTRATSRDLWRCRVGANYASGGSGILSTTGNGTLTMRKQILLFGKTRVEMRRRCGLKLKYLLAQSMFLTSAGGNDFSAFFERGMPIEKAQDYINEMVLTYVKHINELYKMGARRVGMLDVPPMGCTPGSRASMSNGGCNDAANSLAQSFNGLLRREMARTAAACMPGLRYSIGSTFNVVTDMMANPLVAGLKEVKRACCGAGKLNGEVMCGRPNTTYCLDRKEYMFWDMLHGTQATYERGALAIFYGSLKYADPINFASLIPHLNNNATTTGVYSI